MLVSVHILHCASIIFLCVRVPMSNSCIVKPADFEVIKMNVHDTEFLMKARLTPSVCFMEKCYKKSLCLHSLWRIIKKQLINLLKKEFDFACCANCNV